MRLREIKRCGDCKMGRPIVRGAYDNSVQCLSGRSPHTAMLRNAKSFACEAFESRLPGTDRR